MADGYCIRQCSSKFSCIWMLLDLSNLTVFRSLPIYRWFSLCFWWGCRASKVMRGAQRLSLAPEVEVLPALWAPLPAPPPHPRAVLECFLESGSDLSLGVAKCWNGLKEMTVGISQFLRVNVILSGSVGEKMSIISKKKSKSAVRRKRRVGS